MSALTDVARLAGVSKATASRALSGRGYVSAETRDRVVAAAAAIGYVVSSNAASLVTGQSRTIGVLLPAINRWYFGEVLDGIESALIAAGYDLTLYRLSSDAAERRRVFEYFLVRKRVDAVVAVGVELSAHELTLLSGLNKPIVGIGGPIDGLATLSIDEAATARLATEHLVSLGHTDILMIGGDQAGEVDFHVHSQRFAGFVAALADAGLDSEDRFRPAPISIPGGFTVGLSVLADPRSRPTAIVAGCDEVAIGVVIAARQLGIQVPAQLSIIGIDGHDLAEMFGLTTLAQHPKLQGTRAIDLLLGELEHPASGSAGWQEFPTSLTVRSSTTAPAEVALATAARGD